MTTLLACRPLKLQEVLVEIRKQHPLRAGDRHVVTSNAAAMFRDEVLAAGDLREFAARLLPRQLFVALQLLAKDRDDEVRARCFTVLTLRNRRELLIEAWYLVVSQHPAPDLEAFVGVSGYRFGFATISQGSDYRRQRLEQWFAGPSLREAIRLDLEKLRVSDPDAWLALMNVPFGSGLGKGVWASILTSASKSLIEAMGAQQLVVRAEAATSEIQAAFAGNYLHVLRIRSAWHRSALVFIQRKFGVPPEGDQHVPFWRRVAEPVRAEFRRWAQEQELEAFFRTHRDTSGRFQFWRRYSDYWNDVKTALDNRAMLMDFGHVGVIEFAEVGNAAYVYNARDFRRIVHGGGRTPADFKDRSVALTRLAHFDGWQYRSQHEMDTLIVSSRMR